MTDDRASASSSSSALALGGVASVQVSSHEETKVHLIEPNAVTKQKAFDAYIKI